MHETDPRYLALLSGCPHDIDPPFAFRVLISSDTIKIALALTSSKTCSGRVDQCLAVHLLEAEVEAHRLDEEAEAGALHAAYLYCMSRRLELRGWGPRRYHYDIFSELINQISGVERDCERVLMAAFVMFYEGCGDVSELSR